MLFRATGQAFVIPAIAMTLGFFILFAATKLENRMENRAIKLYGFFTFCLLSMCAVFLILGGIFDKEAFPGASQGLPLPIPSPKGEIPEYNGAPGSGVPNGDEEMSLNPDEHPRGEPAHKGTQTGHKRLLYQPLPAGPEKI